MAVITIAATVHVSVASLLLYRLYCPFDHDRIWIRFFGRLGTARHFSRPNFCSGARCAHQFWPQCARSAASAGARLAAGPAAGQAARARARIQPKSPRASSQISEFRSCMHSVSWIHARAGGWEAAHAMEWSRLPGRGGPLNSFEKPAERKLKCVYELRSSGRTCARARGSEASQFY